MAERTPEPPGPHLSLMQRIALATVILILFSGCRDKPGATKSSPAVTWIPSTPTGLEFTRTEITVAQYRECVKVGACTREDVDKSQWQGDPPAFRVSKGCNFEAPAKDNYPMNCVDWDQAKAMCEWLGARLPTAGEWAREAYDNRGEDDWLKAYESPPRGNCANPDLSLGMNERACRESISWSVCADPWGNSVSGLCDFGGNVAEYTSDDMVPHERDIPPKLACGGEDAWGKFPPLGCRGIPTGGRFESVGIRCVRQSRNAERRKDPPPV